MTSLFSLGAVARCSLAATLAMGAAVAQAQSIQWSTGEVDIEFDPSTFAFSVETTSFGGVSSVDVSPLSLGYTQIGNGVLINFNGQMGVYGSSYTNFSPQTLSGSFNAYVNFTPAAGYAITSYTVTYTGSYGVETPGWVSLGDAAGSSFYASAGGSGFTTGALVAGAVAPVLQGSFSATGDLTTIQVLDHYESYISGYETVVDYCEPDDPSICYTHEEPIIVSYPVFRDETDLGEANLHLDSITIEAHVVAVPEPESLALGLAGLVVAGWRLRGRRA
jgi:hypothetical protein